MEKSGNDIKELQHMNLKNLSVLTNGGIFSKVDLLLSWFFPWLPIRRHCKNILKLRTEFQSNFSKIDTEAYQIHIEPYRGQNASVLEMMSYLNKYLKRDLLGAYVHGSVGTCEEILYSDFDALVIIKDSVFNSEQRLKRVAHRLSKARSIMYRFDALQHHGWFVFAQQDLSLFPSYYFPFELLSYAKSLFPANGHSLHVEIPKQCFAYKENFLSHCDTIRNRIVRGENPRNMYQLKLLLSQILLLPALYLQSRDCVGVFKKYSFDTAKTDFDKDDWVSIETASHIRNMWFYNMPPLTKLICSRYEPFYRTIISYIAPKITPKIKHHLNHDFYKSVLQLINKMEMKLS
ncbi:hypothetical protein ACFLR7_00265 [Acidobacteriota bacterium]